MSNEQEQGSEWVVFSGQEPCPVCEDIIRKRRGRYSLSAANIQAAQGTVLVEDDFREMLERISSKVKPSDFRQFVIRE